MSRSESESGQWLLPAAEIPRIKKALRDAHNAVANDAYKAANEFWKANRTTSVAKYRKALDAWEEKAYRPRTSGWGQPARADAHADAVRDATREVLHRIAWQADGGGANLHGATWDDMASVGMAKKTNRDTTFQHGEATVRIDDKTRTVHWHVGENNHAVDRARSGLLGRTLFGHLAKVQWTRGTGGYTRYSSEYDVDEFDMHRGSRIGGWHGPRGAEIHKQETGFYPYDSPQAEAERAKAQEKKRKKAETARKWKAAKKQKQAQQTARKKAAGTKFCGAMKKDRSGLCGRKLAGGKCPDHGTVGAATQIAAPSNGHDVPVATITTDPMG